MPKTCNLVVFWDNEANQTLPVLSFRESGFQSLVDSVVADGATVVLLADCRGAEDLQRCDVGFSVAEAKAGRDAGSTSIVASIDSAIALMKMPELGGRSARLSGLSWNRAAFCSDIGCAPESPVVAHARASVVVAARAFGIPVYDSAKMDDDAGVYGFDGMCIIE